MEPFTFFQFTVHVCCCHVADVTVGVTTILADKMRVTSWYRSALYNERHKVFFLFSLQNAVGIGHSSSTLGKFLYLGNQLLNFKPSHVVHTFSNGQTYTCFYSFFGYLCIHKYILRFHVLLFFI